MGRDDDCDDRSDRGDDSKFDRKLDNRTENAHSLTVDRASGLWKQRGVVESRRYGCCQLTSSLRLDVSADGRAAGKRVTAVIRI